MGEGAKDVRDVLIAYGVEWGATSAAFAFSAGASGGAVPASAMGLRLFLWGKQFSKIKRAKRLFLTR